MPPKVSVLMCVHNADKHYWLDIAIQSILTQSFGEFEFIIVNDGSTDGSVRKIKDYAKNDSRIKLIHTCENIGLTKALNIGLNKCKGEFIVRQDADDVSHPFKIEKQLEMIEKNSSFGVVGCWYAHIDEEGKVFHKCQLNPEGVSDVHAAGTVAGGSPIIRWEVIEKLDGYDEENYYAQDFDFWIRTRQAGWKIKNVQEILYYWRVHKSQISSYAWKEQKECANQIVKKLCKTEKTI